MLGLLLATVAPAADSTPAFPWRDCESIDNGWLYLEDARPEPPPADEPAYVIVDLPHTWNAAKTLERKDYRRGASWYRKLLEVSETDLQQRHFLRFGAAGQQARVFVNGKPCADHG